MKIKLVIELNETTRRAIAALYGEKKPASYALCKRHLDMELYLKLSDLETNYLDNKVTDNEM